MNRESGNNIQSLKSRIELLKFAVWFLVGAGLAIGLIGGKMLKSNLGDLGSFLQGTTGSLWALAGIVLVYIAFLGQQIQILLQEGEIRSSLGDAAEQTQILGQQIELLRRDLLEEQFANHLNSHLHLISDLSDPGIPALRGRALIGRLWVRFKELYASSVEDDPNARANLAARSLIAEHYITLSALLQRQKFLYQFAIERAITGEYRFVKTINSISTADELLLLYYLGKTFFRGDLNWEEFLKLSEVRAHIPDVLLLNSAH